jgi:hypothetical protein
MPPQETCITTGFKAATKRLAAKRHGLLTTKGRRRLLDSSARIQDAKAGMIINRAIRRFLAWLHHQRWYGLTRDLVNPVTTVDVVRSKARRAAAERVVGTCLSKWAHVRKAEKGQQLMNRVRRKMAVFKIEKLVMTVTSRKRRPYQYKLMVSSTLYSGCQCRRNSYRYYCNAVPESLASLRNACAARPTLGLHSFLFSFPADAVIKLAVCQLALST